MTKCCKDKTTEEVVENAIRPDHYRIGKGIEPIEYIRANKMDFLEGNVVKYVSRYKCKGTPIQDLKKARQYLDWLIEEETKRLAAGGEAHG